MNIEYYNEEKILKSISKKGWGITLFESIVGEFPEVEEKKEMNKIKSEKSLFKSYKALRYSVFPLVLILIIIDEIYIRIRDCVKKIDKSE